MCTKNVDCDILKKVAVTWQIPVVVLMLLNIFIQV